MAEMYLTHKKNPINAIQDHFTGCPNLGLKDAIPLGFFPLGNQGPWQVIGTPAISIPAKTARKFRIPQRSSKKMW